MKCNIKWILKKDGVDRDWGSAPGSCVHHTEPSFSVKGGEFLGQLSGYKVLKDFGSVVLVGAAPTLQ
jgi:hypothetical protein